MAGFAWSYSKLKNFEICPRRHFEIDIQKTFKDEEGEALVYGNIVHDVLAKAIDKGAPVPAIHKPDLDKWVGYATQLRDKGMELSVERKFAITENFAPCEYFSRHVWFRGVADVLAVMGPVAIALDWKTGKVLQDSQQLALTAACVFAHNPQVQRVRTEFVWIKDDCTTTEDFTREGMTAVWAGLWPRIARLHQAHVSGSYPVQPNALCRKYCAVLSCAHNGRKS